MLNGRLTGGLSRSWRVTKLDHNVHKLAGLFCPYCRVELLQVIANPRVIFCPRDPICDYDAVPNATPPLTWKEVQARDLADKHQELMMLEQRKVLLIKGIAQLEAELGVSGESGSPAPNPG